MKKSNQRRCIEGGLHHFAMYFSYIYIHTHTGQYLHYRHVSLWMTHSIVSCLSFSLSLVPNGCRCRHMNLWRLHIIVYTHTHASTLSIFVCVAIGSEQRPYKVVRVCVCVRLWMNQCDEYVFFFFLVPHPTIHAVHSWQYDKTICLIGGGEVKRGGEKEKERKKEPEREKKPITTTKSWNKRERTYSTTTTPTSNSLRQFFQPYHSMIDTDNINLKRIQHWCHWYSRRKRCRQQRLPTNTRTDQTTLLRISLSLSCGRFGGILHSSSRLGLRSLNLTSLIVQCQCSLVGRTWCMPPLSPTSTTRGSSYNKNHNQIYIYNKLTCWYHRPSLFIHFFSVI